MGPLSWSILLLVVAVMLVCLEFFVPSGGLIGFLAASAVVASIVLAFMAGAQWGTLMLLVNALFIPLVLVTAVKIWPHTPLGRIMLIQLPRGREDVLPNSPEMAKLGSLVGQHGVAKSKMLPSGAVSVGGRSYDAVSEGMPIEEGQVVLVVDLRFNRIVVRPSQDPPDDDTANDKPPDAGSPDPRLDDPLDKFGLEPLDDPLA